MVNTKDNWSEKEIKILEKYYPTTSVEVIQKLFLPNRKIGNINDKASKLNIHKTIHANRFMSLKERNEIIDMYNSGCNTYLIALKVNRSRTNIVNVLRKHKDLIIKR